MAATASVAYKKLVRDNLIGLADNEDIDREALNSVLEDLGLERLKSDWGFDCEISLTVTASDKGSAIKAFLAFLNGLQSKNSVNVEVQVVSPLQCDLGTLNRCTYEVGD